MGVKNYGLPYQGSKSRIAPWVVGNLSAAETLVDVFFGGGAITHCALLSGKYNKIIANDIRNTPEFFKRCVGGAYRDEKRWVSREEFFKLRDFDPFIACCWSFGNGWHSYLYSSKIEPYKKACHYAVVLDDWALMRDLCPEVYEAARAALGGVEDTHDRRLRFGPAIVRKLKEITGNDYAKLPDNPLYKSVKKSRVKGGLERLQSLQSLESLERLQSLESLESLERLERLQSLQSLESIESIETFSVDYRALSIPAGAAVYCDPPYKGTYNDYAPFDYDAFLEWAVEVSKTNDVYISEYNINDPRFELIGEKQKIVSAHAYKTYIKTERLYKVKQ